MLKKTPRKKDGWVGRYIYHIPKIIPIEEFSRPSEVDVEDYKKELDEDVGKLLELVDMDLNNRLSQKGEKIKLEALHIIGERYGRVWYLYNA